MRILFCFSFISLLFLGACTMQTPLEKMFTEANKVKVLIYAGGTIPEVHDEINDVEKIKSWLKYIDEKKDATGNCAYEGIVVLYFTETDSAQMKFSLNKGCTQITYMADGKPVTKRLTQEGISYLEELKKPRY